MRNRIGTYDAFENLNNKENRHKSIFKLKQLYIHTVENNNDKEEIKDLK